MGLFHLRLCLYVDRDRQRLAGAATDRSRRALLGQPDPPASVRAAVTVAPFGEPIELWKQAPGTFIAALRPDTFRLTLREGAPPQFDWMEHRSYLRPCPGAKQN
jgi:hypothetical protein